MLHGDDYELETNRHVRLRKVQNNMEFAFNLVTLNDSIFFVDPSMHVMERYIGL